MASQQWNFDRPDRFVVGTIGAPGEREFYFQVRQGASLVSLATEKSQASALAQRISTIIREVKKNTPLNSVQPMKSDDGPLELRSDLDQSEDSSESELPTVDVRLDLSLALAFVSRTQALVAGGRPLCPFCISPINPEGHLCPRANGYRR